MANNCVAWLLINVFVVVMVVSAGGIYHLFSFPVPSKPEPIEVNITSKRNHDGYYNRNNELDRKDAERYDGYTKATNLYSNYNRDPRWTLAVPCVVNILVLLPLVLAGLCSRKIFSTTVGFHTSVVLGAINLYGFIALQMMISDYRMLNDLNSSYIQLIAFQLSLPVIIAFQAVISAWELKRQKVKWPVLRFFNIFTLNTVFLVARIVMGIFFIMKFSYSSLFEGLNDEKYRDLYDDFGTSPKIKYPEYFCYPVIISATYCVVVSIENLMSHLLGQLHTKLMLFTTFLSTIFYGGVACVTAPIFVMAILSSYTYSRVMGFALVLLFLLLIHGIFAATKPLIINQQWSVNALLPFVESIQPNTYSNLDLKSRAADMKNKFKNSNTLLYNTLLGGISSLAIVLEISHEVWWWQGIVMVCGNVTIVSRVVPALILETLCLKVENTPILKELMHTIIECTLLIIGVCGSFSWFYGTMAAAILFNILLIIVQIYRLFRSEALKASIKVLKSEGSKQTGTESLVDDRELMDGPEQVDEEQPVVVN